MGGRSQWAGLQVCHWHLPGSTLTFVSLVQLVRSGMQLPARMPRASLNPSIPPPNPATTPAVAGGPPMTQQVSLAHLWLLQAPPTLILSNHRRSSIP